MKKVLIISYYFPPMPAIGAQRPYKLAKYLPRYGWEPIILTSRLPGKPPEGIRVIETDYKDVLASLKSKVGFNPGKGLHEQLNIKVSKNYNYNTWKSKIIKLAKEFIAFPDEQRGWYKFAIQSASEFLNVEKVDAIISTSSPVTSHLIAKKLKQKYKIPWVADLRDLWTQNHYYEKFEIIKYFERKLELKILSRADALVTVSEPLATTLAKLHVDKRVFCITNGYDEEEFTNAGPTMTRKFSLTYTGTLYNGKRDPLLLFETVGKLIREKMIRRDLIEIRFYGRQESWLLEKVNKHKLVDVVKVFGQISHEEALARQRESHVLLLLLWNNDKEYGVYTGKIFEYLGSRRPVIAIGYDQGVVKELLETTGSGRCTVSAEEMEKIILDYYYEFVATGKVKSSANTMIENYSYRVITARYARIMEEVTSAT